MKQKRQTGFTLIELSIVLVIIGLIVGGVLVGQDLIKAAEIRATISQIEKYNTATNTFILKYNGLPGDFSDAVNVGLAATAQYAAKGFGDGNGRIESSCSDDTQGGGENFLYWTHLAQANLITDPTNSITTYICNYTMINDNILPAAKIGRDTRITLTYSKNGNGHYFTLGSSINLSMFVDGTYLQGTPMLTPTEAFNIDSKVDDGNPITGNVASIIFTNPNLIAYGSAVGIPAVAGDRNCYDGSVPGGEFYSTKANPNAQYCELRMRSTF